MLFFKQSIPVKRLLLQSLAAAALAALLFFHLIGLHTVDGAKGLVLAPDWVGFSLAVAAVFVGRLLLGAVRALWYRHQGVSKAKPAATAVSSYQRFRIAVLVGLTCAVLLPFTPLASRYVLDVMTLILTYMVLAYGLNIVVGLTGLLDLGFAVFYALGAYAFALLAQHAGLSFWQALPLAMLVAGASAAIIGAIVLRLRGDYFAVVTLGFAEIVRIILLNWVGLTGGPNGISGIPRPTLFGLSFDRTPPHGTASFSETFGLAFDPMHRIIFLYYLVLAFVGAVYFLQARLRRLPLGRAFEAVREDELAAEALGINLACTKLAAYVIAACCGALAGAFFAARQGFVSPESFTFSESALVLAIVVLGGVGHPLGIALAALLLVGLPEIFREFQDYRLIAFGLSLVLIMILRPSGLFAKREPAIKLNLAKEN